MRVCITNNRRIQSSWSTWQSLAYSSLWLSVWEYVVSRDEIVKKWLSTQFQALFTLKRYEEPMIFVTISSLHVPDNLRFSSAKSINIIDFSAVSIWCRAFISNKLVPQKLHYILSESIFLRCVSYPSHVTGTASKISIPSLFVLIQFHIISVTINAEYLWKRSERNPRSAACADNGTPEDLAIRIVGWAMMYNVPYGRYNISKNPMSLNS